VHQVSQNGEEMHVAVGSRVGSNTRSGAAAVVAQSLVFSLFSPDIDLCGVLGYSTFTSSGVYYIPTCTYYLPLDINLAECGK
jgi:hypothetical protein